jgi:hypothetical protein
MKCRRVRKKLVVFVDGDLAPPDAEAVGRHLEGCERCRSEAEILCSTLDLAVQREDEKTVPPPPGDFVSQFWQREREEGAGGRREARRLVPGGIRQLFGAARYAMAAVSAILVVAFALVVLIQNGKRLSQRLSDDSRKETGPRQPPARPVDRLAEIEKQLEELESAVRRVRSLSDTQISFSGEEMREIYAAIGLAAANSYRDILNMNDVAAKKYAYVASAFPETASGREAEEILSRLN